MKAAGMESQGICIHTLSVAQRPFLRRLSQEKPAVGVPGKRLLSANGQIHRLARAGRAGFLADHTGTQALLSA